MDLNFDSIYTIWLDEKIDFLSCSLKYDGSEMTKL